MNAMVSYQEGPSKALMAPPLTENLGQFLPFSAILQNERL